MDRPKTMAALAIIAAFVLAEVPFGLAEWVAVGESPNGTGTYEIIIQATYQGAVGRFPMQLTVGSTQYPLGGLRVEPVYPIPRTPPITLRYDISINGSKDFQMVSNNMTVFYVVRGSMLKSSSQALVKGNDSYWSAMVDTPLKGQYLAVVDIVIRKGTQYYGGEFRTAFDSDTMSPDVKITYKTDKKVLTPSETFTVEAQVLFGTQALPGLGIVKANIYGSTKALAWNSLKRAYRAEFTAPEKEGIYLLAVYADGQDYLMQGKIYVADVAKAKSARCPMSAGVTTGCTDMKDVRRCAADWKSGNIALKEDQLVSCFESATGGMIFESVICGANKGDLDGDAELDTDDVDLLQNLILPLSPNARKDYEKCADYNLDGFVDNEDLKCLSNVVANKWYGDFNGGICLDAVYDSPLKGDLTGDKFVKDDDVNILKKLVAAAGAGIKIPKLILDATDFNRDGKLTQEDLSCISYFVGMQFAKPETMLAAGQTIPKQCLNIYDLSKCKNIRGDLNGDLRIDSVDEILIMLVNAKQISSYKLACADVNKDGIISLEDVVCVKAYNSNERDKYFACIGCTENTPPNYREPYEVCGDGWDNDCDGLTDRTSTDALSDDCRCNEKTPCWMVQDADGGTNPGVSDGNVKVCRKVEWGIGGTEGIGNNSGYNWMSPSQLTCQKDRECKSMLCADTVYKCAYGANKFKWYDIDEGLPVESDMPKAQPKTCEDQYDNDCNCGDRKCAKEETESKSQWGAFLLGAVLGFGLSYFMGPVTLTIFSSVSSVLSMFIEDPTCKAALGGFSVGLAIGGLTGFGGQGTSAGLEPAPGGGYSSNPLFKPTGSAEKGILGLGLETTGVITGAAGLVGAYTGLTAKEEIKKWVHTEDCSAESESSGESGGSGESD